MTCLVSTKRKEADGSRSVLVTCLSCGCSVRTKSNFKIIVCASCGAKMHKTKYLSKQALKAKVKELESELETELQATARTVIAGFSPVNPFASYRKNRERLKRISALPEKTNKK